MLPKISFYVTIEKCLRDAWTEEVINEIQKAADEMEMDIRLSVYNGLVGSKDGEQVSFTENAVLARLDAYLSEAGEKLGYELSPGTVWTAKQNGTQRGDTQVSATKN